ncbi:hypothetical protein AAG570_012590 [Ranatra chinensis]|uniref:Reverse transcriptase RNase H-like domain-containing protein n=1 Tax=Ranatra chinensis TaxID=642074 RepID=A0ABD0YEA4_9HEMI
MFYQNKKKETMGIETDELFDDINKKKEERQKLVVHPLRHDDYDRSDLSSQKLPELPVKPILQSILSEEETCVAVPGSGIAQSTISEISHWDEAHLNLQNSNDNMDSKHKTTEDGARQDLQTSKYLLNLSPDEIIDYEHEGKPNTLNLKKDELLGFKESLLSNGLSNDENNDISDPKCVLKVKRLIMQRKTLPKERVPKVIIKKTEGEEYKSYIKESGLLQPAVMLERCSQLDELAKETVHTYTFNCKLCSFSSTSQSCSGISRTESPDKTEKYPLPRGEMLDRMPGAQICSVIDLKSGCHQIKMEPEGIEETSFQFERGKYDIRIVSAVKHFRPYLPGRKFVIKNDHKPLVWVEKLDHKSASKWQEILAAYEFEIVHTCGRENVVSDGLSWQVDAIERIRTEISIIPDLKVGYHQIRMYEAGYGKTIFQLRITQMSVKFRNGPKTFQQLTDRFLENLDEDAIQLYMDDIIVISRHE